MILLVSAQDIDELIILQAKAENYYHQGDYSNAIIVFEDLLAEQEITFGKNDIRIGETLQRLGEMYSISGMPDISDYYFYQAIIIFQDSFQLEQNALEQPLLSLMKIYSFQNDSLGIQIVENQLKSISTIFQSPNSIYPYFLLHMLKYYLGPHFPMLCLIRHFAKSSQHQYYFYLTYLDLILFH